MLPKKFVQIASILLLEIVLIGFHKIDRAYDSATILNEGSRGYAISDVALR